MCGWHSPFVRLIAVIGVALVACSCGSSAPRASSGGTPSSISPAGLVGGGTVPATISSLNDISCLSARVCVAVGNSSKGAAAIYTTSGGASWSTAFVPSDDTQSHYVQLDSVSCAPDGHCAATGQGPDGQVALHSSDSGAIWLDGSLSSSGSSPGNLQCMPAGRCYALGSNLLLVSSDGGQTWSYGPNGAEAIGPGGWKDLSCPTSSECVVVGSSISNGAAVVASTTNQGASWVMGSTPSGVQLLYAVACGSPTRCIAVGGGQEDLNGVTVGTYGPVVDVTTDGGAVWSAAGSLPKTNTLGSVACSTPLDCVAVGDGPGLAVYTTNGGAVWQMSRFASRVSRGHFVLECGELPLA